jgi:polysaccharide biosynthesis/export protein
MTIRDLVRAGGSLSDAAFGGAAELTRYKIVDGKSRETQLIEIDLRAAINGDPSANFQLQPFDTLNVKEIQDWGEQEAVTILGEVRFPGRYAIARGETLSSVLGRAGGLSEQAFADGSVFTRRELRKREQQQLDMLARRLQSDLVLLAFQARTAADSGAASALTMGQSLLAQVAESKAVGRLVIDLQGALRGDRLKTGSDIIMRDGDQLVVPKRQQEVTVIGEVQNPTSHLFRSELGRDDYIALSGGATRKADKDRIYVVKANGSVVASAGINWFSRSTRVEISPGDTVVVPLDTERMPKLALWQVATQIVYNLAVAVAAVGSL